MAADSDGSWLKGSSESAGRTSSGSFDFVSRDDAGLHFAQDDEFEVVQDATTEILASPE